MDDSFHFIAPVMPRRRVDPFALKLATCAALAVLVVAGLARFAVMHERNADAAASARGAERQAAEVQAAPLPDSAESGTFRALDEEARNAATNALGLAQGIFADTGSFEGAGPSQLTALQPSLIFVDGPSTSPAIVSIEASEAVWAAAVMGPSGECYWIRAVAEASVTYGTGRACTGPDADRADARAW